MIPAEMSIKALNAYVGGLSNPDKMPGFAYNLPAAECITGSRLRSTHTAEKPNVCGGCYAMKNRYLFKATQQAMYRRLEAIAQPHWAIAMAELINRRAAAQPHFRWHDSGDLQSVAHFAAIVEVARLTPTVRHWLPSREYRIVGDWIRDATAAELETLAPNGGNLNVRLSAHLIGGHAPTFKGQPVTVSTVTAGDPPAAAHRCPAPHQGNRCQSCRACWDPNVRLVDYALH